MSSCSNNYSLLSSLLFIVYYLSFIIIYHINHCYCSLMLLLFDLSNNHLFFICVFEHLFIFIHYLLLPIVGVVTYLFYCYHNLLLLIDVWYILLFVSCYCVFVIIFILKFLAKRIVFASEIFW